MLLFPNGDNFTTGVCSYRFEPASKGDETSRIKVPIVIGTVSTEAVLDTGSFYLICLPDIAELLDIDPQSALAETKIRIRGESVRGKLHRIAFQLIADEGKTSQLEVTAFIADPDQKFDWGGLTVFLGMQHCLETLRFALEPDQDGNVGRFHFAPAWP